jgi:hypothetical protein
LHPLPNRATRVREAVKIRTGRVPSMLHKTMRTIPANNFRENWSYLRKTMMERSKPSWTTTNL